MSDLKCKDITKKYIREHFDVEKERKEVPMKFYKADLELDECKTYSDGDGDFISIKDFISYIEETAKKLEATDIKISTYYDHVNFELYADDDMLETVDDTILRLQKEQKAIISRKVKDDKERAEYERLKAIYGG